MHERATTTQEDFMSDSVLDNEILAYSRAKIAELQSNVSQVLVGQDPVLEQVIIALLAGGHVLLEGVPGLGKTLLIRALAQSIALDYKRVQFTPDLMPADVTGHSMLNMATSEFEIRKGPAFTHLLLADEINRAPAKTQAALLEVMQEHQITIDGKSYSLDDPFMVLATQNPIDNEGTYPLPEAELDRFMMKVQVNYPEVDAEVKLTVAVTQSGQNQFKRELPAVVSLEEILALKDTATKVLVDDRLVEYAVSIVRTSREWQGIVHGAGVRASIALIQTAKVKALIEGHGFVTPDHVKAMVLPVLRHRIILSADQEISGMTNEQVLTDIIEKVPAPRQ
jgi:MoxR-like ATPase